MNPNAPARVALQPGQARMLRLSGGDQLFCAKGSLLLTEPPEALNEQVWRLRRTLRCGEGHAVTRSGWMRVEAGDQPVHLQVVHTGAHRVHDTLPACDPRVTISPTARGVWQLVERLALALASSARQRQQMPS
jgi:hypothetical protein